MAERQDEGTLYPRAERDGRWLPLADAAPVFGITAETLRKQIRRGRREGRHGNDGRWLVWVPPGPDSEQDMSVQLGPAGGGTSVRVERDEIRTELAAELGRSRADLATSRGEIARLEATVEAQRGQIADLRAERDAARLEAASATIQAAELRGRLTEATRPGPLGRLLDALTVRLSGRRSG